MLFWCSNIIIQDPCVPLDVTPAPSTKVLPVSPPPSNPSVLTLLLTPAHSYEFDRIHLAQAVQQLQDLYRAPQSYEEDHAISIAVFPAPEPDLPGGSASSYNDKNARRRFRAVVLSTPAYTCRAKLRCDPLKFADEFLLLRRAHSSMTLTMIGKTGQSPATPGAQEAHTGPGKTGPGGHTGVAGPYLAPVWQEWRGCLCEPGAFSAGVFEREALDLQNTGATSLEAELARLKQKYAAGSAGVIQVIGLQQIVGGGLAGAGQQQQGDVGGIDETGNGVVAVEQADKAVAMQVEGAGKGVEDAGTKGG